MGGDDHADDGGDDGWFGGDDDHHDGGGGHGHGHGDSSMQDLQATLAICVMLVLVTIVFKKVKHHAEHAVPPLMQNVLKALFGKLTVLGFIALYAFMMLKLGLLPAISRAVYGTTTTCSTSSKLSMCSSSYGHLPHRGPRPRARPQGGSFG